MSGTDTTVLVKHYGSLYTMADHKSKAHNIYASGSFQATPKLRLFGTVTFNMSTSEFDPVIMPDVSAEVSADLSHQDFTFDHMHTYSDFDYQLIDLALGGEYALTPTVSFTADAEYVDLTDNAGWVYGVESGSMYMIRSGFRFKF